MKVYSHGLFVPRQTLSKASKGLTRTKESVKVTTEYSETTHSIIYFCD